MSYITPTPLTLDEGQYEIAFPENVVLNTKTYRFCGWTDGNLNPQRIIILNQNKTISANYVEVTPIANVIFSGVVNKQANPGETVKVEVILPGGGADSLTALTDNDGAYSVSKIYLIAGDYSATAFIMADTIYKAAQSVSVPFSIALQDRTITLTVNLT